MQKLIKVIKKALHFIEFFFVDKLIPFFYYFGLVYITIDVFTDIKKNIFDNKIIIFYISSVGIALALTSATFAYARSLDSQDKNKPAIMGISENLLFASLRFIIILFISISFIFLKGKTLHLRTAIHFDILADLFLGLIISYTQVFAITAIYRFTFSLSELHKYLYNKLFS